MPFFPPTQDDSIALAVCWATFQLGTALMHGHHGSILVRLLASRDFDVLYVADPSRSWYGGGDDSALDVWTQRMVQYTSRYNRVLMLGDSMGATAALLFCQQATAVLAFCPQVNTALQISFFLAPAFVLADRQDAYVETFAASFVNCTVALSWCRWVWSPLPSALVTLLHGCVPSPHVCWQQWVRAMHPSPHARELGSMMSSR